MVASATIHRGILLFCLASALEKRKFKVAHYPTILRLDAAALTGHNLL
jgi:hypothetical protein